uniref:Low-density lipoprotein receptor-related protein 2 n=1 Tax=Callorhinchus milii TaxID=7868 RepID=A0A4W3HU78_CALMI
MACSPLPLTLLLTLWALQCNSKDCRNNQFQCEDGRCIPLYWRCDAVSDCSDSSDEQGCPRQTCGSNHFQCESDGECISETWVCDGEEDCDDGSDEHQQCSRRTCSSYQFTCTNGLCIPAEYRCDHVNDCTDKIDERDCQYPDCTELSCLSGACYNQSQKCDGVLDCRDGADETNCTNRCIRTQFECASGDCIPEIYVCDHDDDCGDGSDEQSCVYPSCKGNFFTCPSGHCIHQAWLCDGDDDCGDNADERGCENSEQEECFPGKWKCPGSQHCIPIDKICDETVDCPFGEDETNITAGKNCSISNCAALSCEHRCHASPTGGVCYCPLGFVISPNARSCVDFDECKLWGICDQLCEDQVGSQMCSCVEGYVLEHHKHCRANASTGVPSIIFSNGRDLLMGDIHGMNLKILVQSHNRGIAVGVDFHYHLGMIFWTDTVQNKVFSADVSGSGIRQVLNVSVDTPENLAVDWVNNKLYVVETSIDRIDLVDLDGSNRVTIIAENLGSPRGIALDPTVGYMFFSDWNDASGEPKLERAYMDGTHRFDVVKTKLGWPGGITLDIITKRLYWVDSHFDYLETVTYDGLERKTVLSGGAAIPHPVGITHFEDKLYYTDWTKLGVMKSNKFTESNPQILYQTSLKPYGITVYHRLRQPFVRNPCGSNNSGCEQICVLSHGSDNDGLGFRCKCKLGFDLHSDGKHCYVVSQFLLLSSQLAVRGIPFNISSQEDIILPITASPSFFVGLDFDAVQRAVFFSDLRQNLIYKQNINGTGREILITNRVDAVEDLAFDWISRNLYWTDVRYRSISVLRLADRSRTAIIENLNNPRAIVVHPVMGYIFWTDWFRPAKIMRAWGDGSNAMPIVNTTLGWPNGLAIDWSSQRLYWVDAFFDKIEHSTFSGSDRQTLNRISQISHPFGLTIFGGKFATVEFSSSNYCNRPANPNGDCSHFCFPIPNYQRVCGCPYGMKLDSDNMNCVEDPSNEPPTQQCGSFSFACANGRCVPRYKHCDGVNDCHDNSDELNCGTQNTTCSPAAFTCTNHQCVPSHWRCDGQNDCIDSSDEQNCPTRGPVSCSGNYFTCSNNRCVPMRWVCDTDNDCGDGSDELNFTSTCRPGQFFCPDHRCIDTYFVCDGDEDCQDGADEQGCVYNCTSYEFKCASGDRCISKFYLCDGVFDCNDQSDEVDCPTRSPGLCHQNEFQCQGDGACIPSSWECDGHGDCADGSDEHLSCPPKTCSSNFFRCDNGNCVHRGWLCDGDDDCRDMSDERDCPTQPFRCPSHQWQCPELSVCVNLAKVCDGTPDCPNSADESPLCNMESCSDNNAGCTHQCIQGPFGAQCVCPDGYLLANDSKTCEDIDECNPPGFCSQLCYNERGSFRCTCGEGYDLEADQRTCKVSDSRDALLLVATGGQLISDNISARPNYLRSVIRNGRTIVAVDFDSTSGRIYWSDVTQDKVWSAFQNGTDQKIIFDSGVTVTENIAVDWVGRNLYWADYILETIEVSNLDGNHRTVLLSENITNPRGLVLDPRNDAHLMFWTDWGRNPRIEKASMDGTQRTVIVSEKIFWPNGLAIDYPTKLLYFADAYLDYIEYCDYNGNNRHQVLASDLVLNHPHAITIFEDFVYWTDRYSHRVMRANKWHGENQTVLIYNIYYPLGIVAVHPVRQPPDSNPCASNPCSHLCLLSATGPRFYSCACPSGWKLMSDFQTCAKSNEPFLIVVKSSIVYGISLNPEEKANDAMVPIAGLSNGNDVDFDDEAEMIYWVEYPGEIHQVKSDGTNRDIFAPAADIGHPIGLAFDWISKNLYYTNAGQQSIDVIKAHGNKYRKTLLTNTGQSSGVGTPIGITVDPAREKMYWTDQGTENGIPAKIASADMDGSNPEILFTDNLRHVEFITIDIKESYLYWGVTSTGLIERGNVNGTNRMTVVSDLSHPWGIAVHGNFLYYTDYAYEVIERVDLTTHEKVAMRDNTPGLKCLKVHFRDKSAGSSNGCSSNGGACQHLCLPKPGGMFTCACATGFRLNPDNRTCSLFNSFVVVSQLWSIRGFSLDEADHGEAMMPVGGYTLFAAHLDVHMDSGFIYWCDLHSFWTYGAGIRRIKPDGSSFQNIVVSGIGQNGVRGIAVDWLAGNLYFTNGFLTETYIEVVRLNSTLRRVLIKTSVDRPRHIVVNPKLRYIYWADYGQQPKIERASLDGSNRTILVDDGIAMPRGLAVDRKTDYIYWVDDSFDLIARIPPNGGEREYIRFGSRYPTPYGITIFEDSMIWVDRNLKKIFRASKEPGNTEQPTVIRDNLGSLRDVVMFDKQTQPTSPGEVNNNPCLNENGGCAQFCFALPETEMAKCGCAHGKLDTDGKTCVISTNNFLIYATESTISSLRLDPTDHVLPFPVVNVLRTAVALDYDSVENRIYFTQNSWGGHSKISYISLSSPTRPPTQVVTGLGAPDGIAFDWINKRIYYSDYLNQTINSIGVNGHNRTIIANVPRPRAIVLDPCRGYMYWTDWGTHAKIERATLGGNFRIPIVNTSLVWPNGLTLDLEDQKLYWADASLRKIERSNLVGTDREVIVSTAIFPFAVTLYEEYLYWTDWSTKSIYRVNKDDGSDQLVMIQSLPLRPMDIHVLSDSKQQHCSNPCDQFNGGCSHICTPGPHGAECQCPAHGNWRLANNNKDCVPASAATCGLDYFTCLNGNCIPDRWKCDNDNDCGDRSDEAERVCGESFIRNTVSSANFAFTCDNGRCTPYSYRCDHYNDCGDNSDEADCLFPTCNPNTEFTCNNGRCINRSSVCNGVNNCHDNGTTDETNCPDRTCQSGYVKCQTTNICIPRTYLCDGDNDCGDMSDESATHCATGTCTEHEFRCSSGRCVPSHWYCDREADCADGSDEPSTCASLERTCASQQFQCDDSRCVPSTWICDGDNDCGDMSDEDQRHDYEHQNCTRRSCQESEFTCDNGLCIRSSYRCDRRNDCGDASDERGCTYQPCAQHQFTCHNGRCVSQLWVCDGDNDCGDESDELEHMCQTAEPTCPPQQFKCDNGNCIENVKVCNRVNDCSDNSDEKTCGINECSAPALNHCNQICTNTLTSFICSCHPGYQLMADRQTCEDIDECSVMPSVCSQICENTEGSHVCKCAPGYIREPDGKTCRQNSNIEPYLLFCNRYYIRNLSADGALYSLVVQGLTNVVALDFDRVEQRLYWIDFGRRILERMFLNGTQKETVINHDLLGAESLAVDWVARKLYWVDNVKKCLNVGELDGRLRKRLIDHCIDANNTYCFTYPRGIVVHPKYGYVFWADWGTQAYIGRAGMDGNHKLAIITTKLEWPGGLTIDYTNDKLYWCDAHLNYIEFSDLDGNHRHSVFDGTLAHPFAITLFEDTIYWTDWNTRSVEKANKYTGEGQMLLVNITHRPFDIHVYHPYRQPIVTNPCGVNNGGCSHLCLIASGGQSYTCECPDHFLLLTVGNTAQCFHNCLSTHYRCLDNERCIPIWWKCDGQRDCRDGSDEPATCPVRFCRVGQFQCNDGNCTSSNFLCDAFENCPDGSDEDTVLCDTHECESYQWQCANKRCIPEAWQCDGDNDCLDGSDEAPGHCASRSCSPGQFKCDNGRCIPQAWKCDVDNDCGDNSDEPHDECMGPDYRCDNHTEFSCKTNYRCIPMWAVCNGHDNCRDNSDEQNCEERTCNPSGDFRCDNHQCIPLRWRCDREVDCQDGSDEQNCSPRECTESEFRCDNLRCIPGRWVCDHDNDCEDHSDERDCELLTCLPDYFECNSGHCVPERFKCDGNPDCLDYSDESTCPTRYPNGTYCPPFLFECHNHVCVLPKWRCDGDDDCGDGSDEELHLCLEISCDAAFRFRCDNNRCVYSHELCNGIDDCGDESDEKEEHCQPPTHGPCTTEQYKCGNGYCIPLAYVCDNYGDCPDQSDEFGCFYGTTRSCAENLCEHNCTDLPKGGFICFCRSGYKPSEVDRNNCDDINECEIFSSCPQDCKNSKGSYECFCAEGFRSVGEEHGTQCVANGNPPILLLPDNIRIRRYSLSSERFTDYVQNEEHIKAVGYIWEPEQPDLSIVYWTVLGRGSDHGAIKRAHLTTFDDNGNNPITAVDLELKYIVSPDGIAVDWVGRHIYWTDATTNRIEVAKLDGRYRKWLISSQLDQPAAIAVNPKLGLLYWADWGRMAKIEMAWMDGQHRQVLVDSDLGWPTGLTIDYLNGDRVYWCDSKENLIESMQHDGTDRKLVIIGDLGNPYSLDVFENHLYWTSKERGEVWKQNKFGNGRKVKIMTVNPWLTQVLVYQQNRYNLSVPNPCQDVCSHLCLLNPGGYTCTCPQGSQFFPGSSSECDAAIEVRKAMPPACQCRNGGTFPDHKIRSCEGFIFVFVFAAITVLVTLIIILIVGALAVGGFLNYRRTGSVLPSFPKLPRLSNLVKSSGNGNGVTFRSGADTGMESGASGIEIDSAIDRVMQMVRCETCSVIASVLEVQLFNNNSNNLHLRSTPHTGYSRVIESCIKLKKLSFHFSFQESKWNFFRRKLKPGTNFENPVYNEVMQQANSPFEEASSIPPSSESPPNKPSSRNKPLTFSATENTFKDTATLVKEDSDV